ncbi:uncharacterized protein adgrg11 [Clupea harengus]|uniref:Uncharacterized protein adgrg11 n=1 Tax=Clupea harengus TaxID=7950 RepID=A0A6P8GI79_CLUHA|nr:uncharacterized protein adgrg11 [Clupea harengus]
MDGNNWIIVLTMAVMMLCDTGHGIRVKGDCKNSTITISDESFSGLIKYHTSSNCSVNTTKEATQQQNCTFVFDTTAVNEIMRHGGKNYSFKDLGFWLKENYLKVKKKAFFKFHVYGIASTDLDTSALCKNAGYKDDCNNGSFEFRILLNSSSPICVKCGNPVVQLEKLNITGSLNLTVSNSESGVDPTEASKAMQQMSSVAKLMGNLTAASISFGVVKGVMVKPKDEDDLKKLSFVSSDSDLNLIEDEDIIKKYPLSVSVSEEAYKTSYRHAKENTFVGVFRFPNMTVTPDIQSEKISASDLVSLTYITYIGCGLSLFFLGIGLFLFCCIRKGKVSNSNHILTHLFLALFLLNITFVSNEWIANLENDVACKIIAGLMHYSMLSSFTWYAVEAFHLILQLTKYATVSIPHYKLKLCFVGWSPAALVVLVIFILGKYGELKIYTDIGTEVKMCWILDSSIQYVVNVGYYAIVFLFTFTVFIVMLRWLCYLKSTKVKAGSTGSRDIVTIMGLCCILGISWSFAFFSHGRLRVPSYYIFTILNSAQGFFLFLYYYNTSTVIGDTNNSTSSSTKTSLSNVERENPYKKQ